MALLTGSRALRFLTTVAVCLWLPSSAAAQQPAPLEANVKAVFLYNFTKYVSWPRKMAGEPRPAELRICVTASDAFYSLLKSAVQGEDIDGRSLQPVALDGLDDAKTCQILYVGDVQTLDAREWLNAVRGHQVLTVADGPLNDETVIAFVREDNRIRFDINRASANRRGINISSKLLRLARQVKDR
jgi:YfiR/HmsC-like